MARKYLLLTFLAAGSLLLASEPARAFQVGQAMKHAGQSATNAATNSGKAVKKGAKKAGHGTKKGAQKATSETEKGANSVKNKVKGTSTQ